MYMQRSKAIQKFGLVTLPTSERRTVTVTFTYGYFHVHLIT